MRDKKKRWDSCTQHTRLSTRPWRVAGKRAADACMYVGASSRLPASGETHNGTGLALRHATEPRTPKRIDSQLLDGSKATHHHMRYWRAQPKQRQAIANPTPPPPGATVLSHLSRCCVPVASKHPGHDDRGASGSSKRRRKPRQRSVGRCVLAFIVWVTLLDVLRWYRRSNAQDCELFLRSPSRLQASTARPSAHHT